MKWRGTRSSSSDSADHGQAVDLGEHQVKDDQGGPMTLDGIEGSRAIRRGHDAEAVAFEVRAHEADDLGVVIDDEDRALRERRGWSGMASMVGE
jgi:hypothetical protein